jgi:hypothetical protein
MEAGSAARSFEGSDCCARCARRGARGRASAQTYAPNPFEPALIDPNRAQRFSKPPDGTTRSTQPAAAPSAGNGAGLIGLKAQR